MESHLSKVKTNCFIQHNSMYYIGLMLSINQFSNYSSLHKLSGHNALVPSLPWYKFTSSSLESPSLKGRQKAPVLLASAGSAGVVCHLQLVLAGRTH